MKAYVCVGSHGHIFVCEQSPNTSLIGRLEVYQSYEDAKRNALTPDHVMEVTITIHRKKKALK